MGLWVFVVGAALIYALWRLRLAETSGPSAGGAWSAQPFPHGLLRRRAALLSPAPEVFTAVVVGAGPSGLAVSAALAAAGVDHVVLERNAVACDKWRRLPDAFALNTPAAASALSPHAPFVQPSRGFPSRDEFLAYVDAFVDAAAVRPNLRTASPVARTRMLQPFVWLTETADGGRILSHFVVLCCGLAAEPHVPAWAGPGAGLCPRCVMHTSQYRSPAAALGARAAAARVLVVGGGTSASDALYDFVRAGARPDLAVRGPAIVVRSLPHGLGAPFAALIRRGPALLWAALGWLVVRLHDRCYADLAPLGLARPSDARLRAALATRRHVPLFIDHAGALAPLLRSRALAVRPGVASLAPRGGPCTGADGCACTVAATFDDGTGADYDLIVLGTGYGPPALGFLAHADRLFWEWEKEEREWCGTQARHFEGLFQVNMLPPPNSPELCGAAGLAACVAATIVRTVARR